MDYLRHLNLPLVFTVVLGCILLLDKARCMLVESVRFQRFNVRLFPKSAEAHLYLGYALYSKARQYEEAEREIRQAIALRPGVRQGYYTLAAVLAMKTTWKDDLEQLCVDIFRNFPDDPMGYLLLGRWQQEQGCFGEAETAFRKAISLAPLFDDAYLSLASVLFSQGRIEESVHIFKVHRDLISPNSVYFTDRALAVEKQGNYKAALDAINNAIRKDPKSGFAYRQLGLLLHRRLDRYQESEAAYRKSIDLNPKDGETYYQLAWLLNHRLNRPEEAEDAIRRHLELVPNSASGQLQLGLILHEGLQRYSEAEQAYRKSLELSPDGPNATETYRQLGLLLHENLHRYSDAEAMFQKALQLEPDDETTLYNIACAKCRCMDLEGALDYLRRAMEKGSDGAWAWNDRDLEPLKVDPRFAGIVGERPEPEREVR